MVVNIHINVRCVLTWRGVSKLLCDHTAVDVVTQWHQSRVQAVQGVQRVEGIQGIQCVKSESLGLAARQMPHVRSVTLERHWARKKKKDKL